jgi:hypothetical protein
VENFVGACKRERKDVFRSGAGRKFRVSCGGESERADSEIGNDRAENIRSSFRSSFWSSGSHEIRVLSRVVSVTRHIQGGRYFSAQVFGRDRFFGVRIGQEQSRCFLRCSVAEVSGGVGRRRGNIRAIAGTRPSPRNPYPKGERNRGNCVYAPLWVEFGY